MQQPPSSPQQASKAAGAAKPTQVAKLPQQQLKVLRIGILQSGKIVQERRLDIKENVFIGDSPKATFQLPLDKLPKKFPLFVCKGDTYVLQFTEAMSGKIAFDNEVLGLDELRQKGKAAKKGDSWTFTLHEKNRGKIAIGNYTILFQFVPAPPEPLHPVIQTDFRAKILDEDDPVFLAFLGLFSVLATIFVVYVKSVEPVEIVDITELPKRFVELALDVPKEKAKNEGQGNTEQAKEEKRDDTKKTEKAADDNTPRRQLTAEEKQAAEIARKQQMEAEVAQRSLLLKMIGTRGESGATSKVEDLFNENDGVGQNLADAMRVVNGVEVGTTSTIGVKEGLGEGTSRADASIGELAKADGGNAKLGTGPATKVKGRASTGEADLTGEGDPGKVKAVVQSYLGQVQACYEQFLKQDPTLKGRVEVQWNIVNGRVSSAKLFSDSTHNTALANCIVNKVRYWSFPKGIEMEAVYPFILSPG